MGHKENLVGRVFKNWVVLRKGPISRTGNAHWICMCLLCGKDHAVFVGNLKDPYMNRKCKPCTTRIQRTTHGGSSGGETKKWYGVWAAMKRRCTNSADPAYPSYGGRGIFLDPRWEDPANFYADMGDPPQGSSLDRIDNDGPYSRENCRWASAKDQARNRRSSRLITARGETKTLAEWAEVLGVPRSRISDRIKKGWDVEEALYRPKLVKRGRA